MHCASCNTPKTPLDLVPGASCVLLRGRCRYCAAPIPMRVPLVEAGTGLLFLLLWWRYGRAPETGLLALIVSALVVIGVIGWESRAVAGPSKEEPQ